MAVKKGGLGRGLESLFEDAARAGLAASAIAMEGAETINPALNAGAVRGRAGI